MVGCEVGILDGLLVGNTEGIFEGIRVGLMVGSLVGLLLGMVVGTLVGAGVGLTQFQGVAATSQTVSSVSILDESQTAPASVGQQTGFLFNVPQLI